MSSLTWKYYFLLCIILYPSLSELQLISYPFLLQFRNVFTIITVSYLIFNLLNWWYVQHLWELLTYILEVDSDLSELGCEPTKQRKKFKERKPSQKKIILLHTLRCTKKLSMKWSGSPAMSVSLLQLPLLPWELTPLRYTKVSLVAQW